MCSHKLNNLNKKKRSHSANGFNRATSWKLRPPAQGLDSPHLPTGDFTSPNLCLPFRFPTHSPFPQVSHSPSSIKNPLTLGPTDGSTIDGELLPDPGLPSAHCLKLSTTSHYGEDGLTSRSLESQCFKQKDQPPRPTTRKVHHKSPPGQPRLQSQGPRKEDMVTRHSGCLGPAPGGLPPEHPDWPTRHLHISLLPPFLQWILIPTEQLACSSHSASEPASKETRL